MDNTQKDPQYHHLDTRVSHLDNRVNSLAEDMSSVKTSVEAMAGQMTTLITTVNTKQPTNWIGIGSLILGLMIGGAGFVSLRVAPLENRDAVQRKELSVLNDFRYQMHYEVGMFETEKEQIAGEVARLWDHIHKQEEIDREQDAKIAELGIITRAIGDYSKDIDRYGSRKWMNKAPTNKE